MSFMVMPSERESGEIMGGGDWAREYSYRNPTTGKWEYTSSPRIYGDNGNMTYDEWMRSLGREPGSYGANASEILYNQWVESVTDKGKGRMNGSGEYIEGTKPTESIKGSSSAIESPTTNSEKFIAASSNGSVIESPTTGSEKTSEQVSNSEENKGTEYSWLTDAAEEVIPENKEDKEGLSKDKEGEYYTFGITKEPSKKDKEDKEDKDEYNWVTDTSNENKPANKINDISNAIKNIGKDAEKENKELAKANPEATEEFDIGGKVGKNFRDVEKDYQEAFRNYEAAKALKDADKEKEAKEALEKSKKAMRDQIALENKVANETMNEFIEMVNKPDVPGLGKGIAKSAIKYNNTKIGDMTVYVTKSDADENAVNVIFVTPDGREVDIGQVGTEGYVGSFSNESLASRRDALKSQIELTEKTYEKSLTETPGVTPETKEEIPTKIEEAMKETVDKITSTEEEKPIRTVKEIKEEYAKIDVSTVTNAEEAIECKDKIKDLTTEGVQASNRDFVTIYNELVNKGIKAKDLYNQPEITKYSQESFEFGQDIYEKYSELEAKTNELGLTADKLNKKYINKNIDEISLKVAQLDPEKTKITGSYYSPGSDMNGTSVQPTGIKLSKEEVKALSDYADDIQCGKDAGLAIMKSSAFNGAKNVKGGKYTEEWKNSAALETVEGGKVQTKEEWKNKLSWKDYFAAGVKGTLGTVVTALGVAVAATNPILGILLMVAGTNAAGKAGLDITTKVVRSKSTNEEMMFGSGEGGKDVFRDIYNRTLEPANIGDPRSIGTYTNLGSGAVNIATGFVELLENPVVGITTIREGIEDINRVGNGGLRGNIGNGINNIYELGVDVSTFLDREDLKPEALGLTKTTPTFVPNIKDKRIWNGDYTVYADTDAATEPIAASEYGSAESSVEELTEEEKEALDATYSGAREQAKNSNIATDYNAGMEQEVNEAVSDKYVKMFKIMIDKEPDYIRKVLIAIPKNHCEREWK